MDVLQTLSPVWIKRGLLAALALAIVGGLAYGLTPRPVPVDTAVLEKGPLRVTVDEEGKTRVRDVYTVSAPIPGQVLRSPLEPGDAVIGEKTVVAEILPTAPPFLDLRGQQEAEASVAAAVAAVALAEAELKGALSELKFAERELERARALASRDTIPERALEKARVDAETATAAVAKSEAGLEVRRRELESARARLIAPSDPGVVTGNPTCCLTVRSPVSGRVLEVVQKSEQPIAVGAPLALIGDTSDIEIVVELLSSDAVKVREGAKATIEGWGGPPLAARLTRIEPAGFTKVSALGIEEQRVRVVLDLVEKDDVAARLGHAFRVFVRIVVQEETSILRVPLGALFRSGGSWAVFVVESGRARLRPIELGARNTTHAAVISGIEPGARIILHPSDRVTEGARVAERGAGSRAE